MMEVIKTRGSSKIPDRNKISFGSKNKPVQPFSTLLMAIGLSDEQESFLRFIKDKPRLMTLLRKETLTNEDKNQLEAAYTAFKNERERRALVKREAPTIAATLGISENEAEGYLEFYSQEHITKLVVLATEIGVDPKNLMRIDAALMEDGSYATRREETIAVSTVHAELEVVITREFKVVASKAAVDAKDVSLDALWDLIVEKHQGDEQKAAEEYATEAGRILDEAKKSAREIKPYKLSTALVVEILKLFNYNTMDVHAFMDYAREVFRLDNTNTLEIPKMIVRVVEDFVREHARSLVLNSTSKLYRCMRIVQLDNE